LPLSQRRIEELEAAKASAETTARERALEAVGRLAGGLAHDFNNLLTAINGYGEIASSLAPAEGPLREALEEIQSAGERAAALTRQLLAYGRRQAMSPVAFDLNATLGDLERMLRRLVGPEIRVEFALQGGLGRIHADPGQVQRIIMDMALNARDAMPSGGLLTLRTAEVMAAPLAGNPPEPYVMLAIADTGTGMDEGIRERVFDPFYSTRRGGDRTGMGLAAVYGAMRQSGGFTAVESAPGSGSVFRLYFPAVDAKAPAGRPQ
jgi:signal transduction histidine kinase